MKRRDLAERYCKQNGGPLLLQKLATYCGSHQSLARIYTSEERSKATKNYNASRILVGGSGTVYKGILPYDSKTVAIKKSKFISEAHGHEFANIVIVLSQIYHRNLVELVGCCLETQVPLLVYEFIPNGNLYEHIHSTKGLPWELRMKIASDVAEVIAYMHYSMSMPILHMNLKTTKILLDEEYKAKVSGFATSDLVPEDQDQVSAVVINKRRYLDPEYLYTNMQTEKSDVYSFGVVLAELLTSKVAYSYDRPKGQRQLAILFVRSVEQCRWNEILDTEIIKDRNFETAEKVAGLAKRCLRLRGKERPSMKNVAMELEGLMLIVANNPTGEEAV